MSKVSLTSGVVNGVVIGWLGAGGSGVMIGCSEVNLVSWSVDGRGMVEVVVVVVTCRRDGDRGRLVLCCLGLYMVSADDSLTPVEL